MTNVIDLNHFRNDNYINAKVFFNAEEETYRVFRTSPQKVRKGWKLIYSGLLTKQQEFVLRMTAYTPLSTFGMSK